MTTPPSTVKIVTTLQLKYRCDSCDAYCWVIASDKPNEAGQHRKLTHQDLGLWAHMIVSLCVLYFDQLIEYNQPVAESLHV